MEFYASGNAPRPIRLCEATRRFAYDSLHHVYGLDTKAHPSVEMEDTPGFDSMTELERYNASIRKIAETAPIRICPGEKISGAATLGLAIAHTVPAVLHGQPLFIGVSHLTLDFETVLKRGISGIANDIQTSLSAHQEPRNRAFLESCLSVTASFRIWHQRYIDALAGMPEYASNRECLLRVPWYPATTFHEAVQSLWATFAFVRLCGNWPGFGRIDYLLGDYLQKDLAAGRLTLDEAREILAHFFIKGCEWICGGNYDSGDAQHYQNIVLSGVDGDGRDITNDVTYLVLDIIEELGISDFPTTLRLNRNSDPALLRRAAEVVRLGGGILAFYNEDLILKSLTEYGYPAEEAWKFANDGCWEVQIPGKTFFAYTPFDALQILLHTTLQDCSPHIRFPDFESLYQRYVADLNEAVRRILQQQEEVFAHPPASPEDCVWAPQTPCTVVSLFEQGCIAKGLSYLEGGPVYHIRSPHIGGLPDVVNSLYAIQKLVFEEQKLTFGQLMEVLRNNWDGCESLRQYALNEYSYYGNDNDACDAIAVRLIADFAAACRTLDGKCRYSFPPGISTFGRQLEWAPHRLAAPHGHKKGAVLAPNCSPTPGSDHAGATAIIRSYTKADLSKMVTGAALDIKLLPSSMEGDDGLDSFVALLQGFVALGGYFVQPDVQDAQILREAQEHPEDFPTLSVRVSGWNARFVTLSRQWQDMIINENHG